MKLKAIIIFLTICVALAGCDDQSLNNNVIAENGAYTVTGDSVIQGDFIAYAVSPTEIATNYRSPADGDFSPVVEFRLSLNSRDNELKPGLSHFAVTGSDSVVTLGVPQSRPSAGKLKPLGKNTRWTLRVNLSPLLKSFKEKGYFVTVTGDTIHQADFKGVWIAGNALPLTWDFENLYGKPEFKLHPTQGDSIYAVTLTLNPETSRPADPQTWKIEKLNPDYPTYSSGQMLVDALYNMAIDDMASNVRRDGTYRAGAAWDGVWTRDVSYSTYLALAYLDPVRAMNSLRAKVKDGRIVQDTGTGGSWPVSTDRVIWGVAAWEIYKVTGNKKWLREAYNVIRNTASDDRAVIWDREIGLMHGEQSYLDWREQSYPRWMQPKDIFESMCLGTNVIYAQVYSILSDMGDELGLKNNYGDMAMHLKDAINQNLWNENNGYYSAYLYGGIYPIQAPGIDNLGQALSVIWNIADDDRAETLMQKTPVTDFGIPSTFPRIKDIKPYHNDAVWPFVQAFWNIAAARAGNENMLRRGLGALYRAAALFGTHKELFVASTGDFRGTAVNSDRMLWSAAGNVAMIFRVYAGMEFLPSGILFTPTVPGCLKGKKFIQKFKYRNATLNITLNGTGNDIESMTIDGKKCDSNFFPATMSGKHSIVINMVQERRGSNRLTVSPVIDMPATPLITWNAENATIGNFDDDTSYRIFYNGKKEKTVTDTLFSVPSFTEFTKIYAVPQFSRITGFMSRPRNVFPEGSLTVYQCEKYAAAGSQLVDEQRAKEFVETTTTKNTDIVIPVKTKSAGIYYIDVRYANGNGPVNTENKCALRTVVVNTHAMGTIVMPQRGLGEWYNTGFSNMLQVELLEGDNIIEIKYIKPQNVNMNGSINTALIDYVRVIKK